MRTAPATTNNLSYSKGYEKGNIRATFSYTNQQGIVEKSGQERITGRLNLQHKFLDDKLTLAIQSSISSVNLANPTWTNDDTFDAGGGSLNPANLLTNYQSESNSTRLLMNASLDYQFSNDFSTKVNLGIDNFEGTSTSVFGSGVNGINRVSGNGQGAYNQLESKSNLLEWTVNYKKGFGNVKLDAVAGYSFQDFRTFGFNSQGWGFGSSTLDQISSNLAVARDQVAGSITGSYQWRVIHYKTFSYHQQQRKFILQWRHWNQFILE